MMGGRKCFPKNHLISSDVPLHSIQTSSLQAGANASCFCSPGEIVGNNVLRGQVEQKAR